MVSEFTLKTLEEYKNILSKQQYKTLRGQIKAGDVLGAEKGLKKCIKKNNK